MMEGKDMKKVKIIAVKNEMTRRFLEPNPPVFNVEELAKHKVFIPKICKP